MEKYLNKITCGDSYKLIKELPDKSVDCIYTDIPYLYEVGKCNPKKNDLSDRIERKRKELEFISGGIDYSILDEFKRVLKKVNIFIWCSKMQLLDIMNWGGQDYNCELLVWCKTNPQPSTNNTWLPDVEYCVYFREKGVPLNDGYELKSKYHITAINKKDKDLLAHPTIKPIELVKRHLLHTTQPNDIVLDCFMGSGTTAVACKQTGRQFIGFEIEEKWCKVANDRLNGVMAGGQMSLLLM
jgi:DNA modification methylase